MRSPNSWNACLLLFLTLSSCSGVLRIEPEIFSSIELKSNIRYIGMANKKTIEGLLGELWNSGFFQKNELIMEEIFNNDYGLFYKGRLFSSSSLKKRRAYYVKIDGLYEKVMLNKKLFRHWEPSFDGRFILRPLNKRIKATLVHELFHDFWYNVLDNRKRFLFSIEAQIFFLEAMIAKTTEDKMIFLSNIGLDNPRLKDFKPLEELIGQKKFYTDQKFFGTEMYSKFADRAFSGKMTIPKYIRKFYYGILSESALNMDRK